VALRHLNEEEVWVVVRRLQMFNSVAHNLPCNKISAMHYWTQDGLVVNNLLKHE
jgi:hypothetical protein